MKYKQFQIQKSYLYSNKIRNAKINTVRKIADTSGTPHRRFTFVHLQYPYLIPLVVKPFPKRSAPWLFTTAPLGGLKPPSARRLRWIILPLENSTISITACSDINCRSLLLGASMKSCRLRAISYQGTRKLRWATTLE